MLHTKKSIHQESLNLKFLSVENNFSLLSFTDVGQTRIDSQTVSSVKFSMREIDNFKMNVITVKGAGKKYFSNGETKVVLANFNMHVRQGTMCGAS